MEALVKKHLETLLPELMQGKHLLQFATITGIPDPPKQGDQSTAFDPKYAVDIQLLDKDMQPQGPIYEAIPLPAAWAGNERGVFGFPPDGTVVSVMFAYGDPERPVIQNIYPTLLSLPALKPGETLLQHSPDTYLRSTVDEAWVMRAKTKLWIGNADINLVAEVQRLASLLADHKHPKTAEPINAAEIGDVANKVEQIKL